eukprot:1195743-Prorocentrum_minimum.AAC.5
MSDNPLTSKGANIAENTSGMTKVRHNHHTAHPERPAGVTQSSHRTPREARGRDTIITPHTPRGPRA